MSATEEKKFVIKHVFTDFKNLEMGKALKGKLERHFDVPWCASCFKDSAYVEIYLDCPPLERNEEYKVETKIELKLIKKTDEQETVNKNFTFSKKLKYEKVKVIMSSDYDDYLIDGHLQLEFIVRIKSMTGVQESLVRFDESAKEFSDVVLVVEDLKFYVCKMYLASHSTYFKALLMGGFDESKQSEVELKGIDSYDFQNFLELIHGEQVLEGSAIDGILKLADFFDSKLAMRRCEDFLIKRNMELNQKFQYAMRYKMEKLTEKCFAEMKSSEDVRSVLPEDPSTIDYSVWKALVEKSLDINQSVFPTCSSCDNFFFEQ